MLCVHEMALEKCKEKKKYIALHSVWFREISLNKVISRSEEMVMARTCDISLVGTFTSALYCVIWGLFGESRNQRPWTTGY